MPPANVPQTLSASVRNVLIASALGCAGEPAVDGPADSPGQDTATDTAPRDTAPFSPCPEGMAAVPTESPTYCIDAYEVSVEDDIARSEAGALPSQNISFDEARAICEATPVVDAAGDARGYKHLATSAEWEDAGDGTIGAGGSLFPYGDSWDDEACATANEDGSSVYTEAVPAGSLSACVSPFGVYDQIGNLWEFMDPELSVDAALATTRFAEEGLALTVGGGSELYVDGDVTRLMLQVMTVQPGTVSEEDGRLYVSATEVQWGGEARGYLTVKADAPEAGWYPVQLVPDDDGDKYWIHADLDRDGGAIPDKRGCAYYVGYGQACALSGAGYFHTSDFIGTVGFRCASPPLTDA